RRVYVRLEWFFFFQAEDGIRDGHVTGVQTCALPILDDALLLLTLAVKAEDWRLLYVVYEIIEDHHKGQVATVAKALRGGTEAEAKRTVNEIKRFKATANNRRVLGIKARHGHRKHAAPSRPMTFKEARALVEELLAAWLRSLP